MGSSPWKPNAHGSF